MTRTATTTDARAAGRSLRASPAVLGDTTSAREIRRRLPLPGGRAVLGALLITTAAVGSFAAATREEAPSGRFVVAARPLAIGDVLGASDVVTVAVDLPDVVGATLLRSADEVVGSVVLAPVDAGTPLSKRALEAPGTTEVSRYRELSVAVPIGRALDGKVRTGDLLDVLASDDRGTSVLVQQATVVSVNDGSSGGLVDGGDVIVTLALTTGDDVLAVAHWAARGELTLVRASRADDRLPQRFVPTASVDASPASGSSAAGAAATGAAR